MYLCFVQSIAAEYLVSLPSLWPQKPLYDSIQCSVVVHDVIRVRRVIMDKIPDQIGYLVLTEDGAVLESGGELENDERVATIITDLITLSNKVDPLAFGPNEQFKKISITYDDHWFVICLSNKKIHVVKRSIQTSGSEGNTVIV